MFIASNAEFLCPSVKALRASLGSVEADKKRVSCSIRHFVFMPKKKYNQKEHKTEDSSKYFAKFSRSIPLKCDLLETFRNKRAVSFISAGASRDVGNLHFEVSLCKIEIFLLLLKIVMNFRR